MFSILETWWHQCREVIFRGTWYQVAQKKLRFDLRGCQQELLLLERPIGIMVSCHGKLCESKAFLLVLMMNRVGTLACSRFGVKKSHKEVPLQMSDFCGLRTSNRGVEDNERLVTTASCTEIPSLERSYFDWGVSCNIAFRCHSAGC